MSVNHHHNGQKFTDKSLENVGLSVKCVLITDKMVKNGRLSVKIQPFRPWFYGQMLQKAGFVRKSA
ncbi:hypothetical protein [Ligilactobacillus ruminis]|uniref:hypothetical protein n=1 Tax=Ligilactobacillus ruminis TaxID=1623 RepID=UPI0038515403